MHIGFNVFVTFSTTGLVTLKTLSYIGLITLLIGSLNFLIINIAIKITTKIMATIQIQAQLPDSSTLTGCSLLLFVSKSRALIRCSAETKSA